MFTDNEHYKSELDIEIVEKESHSCGNFINFDYKRHEDLNQMLNSNRENLKLEAMKRIIEMIAKGKDASDLFPAVVKNVVTKNIEVKKLVYVYLVRYAEEKQQLALLSISTFQRSLKEPNQLIRASGLKVLSNIRVAVIVPIVLLAIREAAADLSPYVRKTVAHAIPKLYNLDPKLKSELIIIIQKLLQDSEVLVIGSAVMAYTEVCPERVDLIHSVFHKLCILLTDVDEWGQVVIINTLTRYARTQFVDPNKSQLDSDHQLLLHSGYPLLQSRNSAVVMAVAQLYIHCGSKNVIPLCIRALVRLLHLHTEIQNIVLYNMITISSQNKEMFQPYLKKFFVRTSDSIKIKLLKLDILTNIVTDSNITLIVSELQTYIMSNDKTFVAASIQAIGKCACSISEITSSCLNGLVRLLSNKDEAIVAESVVVIKTLFQTQSVNCKEIIMQMARLINSITIPQARAAILWLLGENLHTIPQIVSVVLCNVSKTFSDEHDIVKLQILNLVIKFYIINPQESRLFCQYILDLAKYDVNYDIRDRARLMRNIYKNSKGTIMSQVARVFLVKKPAPTLNIEMTNQGKLFQLGTLSHYINENAVGYVPLPPFPIEPASKEVRKVKEFNILEESKRISNTINENSSTTSSNINSDSENSSTTSSNINSDSESSISSAENETLPLCNNGND